MTVTLSAAVLAGGGSRRMGRDKALLEIGGRPMMARVIERIRALFGEISIVGGADRSYGAFGVPVFRDARPGCGSLGGIYTALSTSSAPFVFCLACDMPFISAPLVSFLVGEMRKSGCQAVIPRVGGELEPLCAVYSREIIPVIEKDLDTGVRRIKSTLSSLRLRIVEEGEMQPHDPGLHTFFNVNTPEDLRKAKLRIESDAVV